ncbi:MAG: hypothetical protein ACLRYB_18095 [Segatella copri]
MASRHTDPASYPPMTCMAAKSGNIYQVLSCLLYEAAPASSRRKHYIIRLKRLSHFCHLQKLACRMCDSF